MNCLICNRDVGDDGTKAAVAVSTHGNFGSGILDNDGTIRFSICDHCIVERQDRIRLKVERRCQECHSEVRGYNLFPLPKGMIPSAIDSDGYFVWDKEIEQ